MNPGTRVFKSELNETQAWERSAERNPPSRGRARALARHAEISREAGKPDEFAHRASGKPAPRREAGEPYSEFAPGHTSDRDWRA
jgi:hypothetical protein